MGTSDSPPPTLPGSFEWVDNYPWRWCTFTTDLVRTIKSCRNSNVFDPDKLSISHLEHLGHRTIEYITLLFNLSVITCQIPAIWKSSSIIPIPKPGKDTSQGTSYRPISLFCPSTKVLESVLIYYQQLSPSCFRPTRFQTCALDHLRAATSSSSCHQTAVFNFSTQDFEL